MHLYMYVILHGPQPSPLVFYHKTADSLDPIVPLNERDHLHLVYIFVPVESFTDERIKPLSGSLRNKKWAMPCNLCSSFYINSVDEAQRLCIILARRPKFLTRQFAVFLGSKRQQWAAVGCPVCCSVKAPWLFARGVTVWIWNTTTDER